MMTNSISRYYIRKVEGATKLLLLFCANCGKWTLVIKVKLLRGVRGCCIQGSGNVPANCKYFKHLILMICTRYGSNFIDAESEL